MAPILPTAQASWGLELRISKALPGSMIGRILRICVLLWVIWLMNKQVGSPEVHRLEFRKWVISVGFPHDLTS